MTDRYVSQAACEHSLDAEEANNSDYANRVPKGTPWAAPASSTTHTTPPAAEVDDMPGLTDIEEPLAPGNPSGSNKEPVYAPENHQELPGFTGDRVLRNSQIFLMQFGWWIEMATAVPEGDIGRVWEILKVGSFDLGIFNISLTSI